MSTTSPATDIELSPEAGRVLRFVRIYVGGTAVAVEAILQRLGAGHPLHAWREGRLPARGHLPKPLDGSYRFRGDGCVIRFGSIRIEFDFGEGGRYDGFNAYYLDRHIRFNKAFRKEFGELRYAGIDTALRELERAGLVFDPELESANLLYLTDAGKRLADVLHRAL